MSACLSQPQTRGHGPPRASATACLLVPVVFFLLLHLSLRLLAPASLCGDDADLLFFNQALAWGYSEQPPLYSWLYFGLSLVVGEGNLSLSLLRALLLGGTAWFLSQAAQELFGDGKRTLLAGFSLLVIPELAWHSVTYLTHSLLLCCVCAATLWVCARIAKYGRPLDYLLLGLCAGLGVLSKYNYVAFFACLLGAAWTIRELRARFLNWRMLGVAAIAGVLVLPHALWLWNHAAQLEAIYHGKLEMGKATWLWRLIPAGAVDLFKDAVVLAAPTLGLFALTFPRAIWPGTARAATIPRRWLGRLFLAALLLHLAAIFAARAGRWHERWLEPFFLFLPLYLFAGLSPSAAFPRWRFGPGGSFTNSGVVAAGLKGWQSRCYVAALIIIAIALTLGRGAQVWLGGSNRGYNPIDSDYRPLGQRLQREIAPGSVVIAEEAGLAGNLRLQVPALPCLSVQNPLYRPAIRGERGPAVVIWDAEYYKEMPPWVRDYVRRLRGAELPGNLPPRQLDLPPVSPGRPQRTLHYLILK